MILTVLVDYIEINTVKLIHKEYSRLLNQFFPIPRLYHELNMIIHTSCINI